MRSPDYHASSNLVTNDAELNETTYYIVISVCAVILIGIFGLIYFGALIACLLWIAGFEFCVRAIYKALDVPILQEKEQEVLSLDEMITAKEKEINMLEKFNLFLPILLISLAVITLIWILFFETPKRLKAKKQQIFRDKTIANYTWYTAVMEEEQIEYEMDAKAEFDEKMAKYEALSLQRKNAKKQREETALRNTPVRDDL